MSTKNITRNTMLIPILGLNHNPYKGKKKLLGTSYIVNVEISKLNKNK